MRLFLTPHNSPAASEFPRPDSQVKPQPRPKDKIWRHPLSQQASPMAGEYNTVLARCRFSEMVPNLKADWNVVGPRITRGLQG